MVAQLVSAHAYTWSTSAQSVLKAEKVRVTLVAATGAMIADLYSLLPQMPVSGRLIVPVLHVYFPPVKSTVPQSVTMLYCPAGQTQAAILTMPISTTKHKSTVLLILFTLFCMYCVYEASLAKPKKILVCKPFMVPQMLPTAMPAAHA